MRFGCWLYGWYNFGYYLLQQFPVVPPGYQYPTPTATAPNPQYAPIQPVPPPAPPLPAGTKTVAPPTGNSTPKTAIDIGAYSPISEADSNATVTSNVDTNNNHCKHSIVMSDKSVDVSVSSSLAANSNMQNVDIANCDKVQVIDVHDSVIDTDIPVIDHNLDSHPVVNENDNVVNDVTGGSVQVKQEPLPSFDVNVQPLPHLSITKRVSTAYKHFSFPRKPNVKKRVTSEAHGSDEETSKSDDVIENSFPIASTIMKGWQDQTKSFKASLKAALVMDKEQQEAQKEQLTEPSGEGSQSKPKSDDATLFSKNTPTIFKNKPTRKQGDFYYHEEKFGQFVQLDSNIELLTPAGFDPSSYKLQVNLSEEEVRNLQTAMSFGLHAESHTSSYITATRRAINSALLKLDPAVFPDQISALHDAKHMLYGAANAVDQSVQMLIYVHAGLTATLRTDFLKNCCYNLPTHVKQELMYSPFGGSALFNSQIGNHITDIEIHRQKEHNSNIQNAVSKSMTQNQNKRSDNFVPPSVPLASGQGQGQPRGGFHNNRGRGNQNGGSFRGRGGSAPNFHQNRQQSRSQSQGNRGKPKSNFQGNRQNNRKKRN